MKIAEKIVFLLQDPEGFGSAIVDALLPNPDSSFRRLEDSFELPLVKYGIKDDKASGKIVHFVDDKGVYQVSVLLLQSYDPPTLSCALNEVLEQITEETSSLPTILAPFLVAASKLRFENRSLAANSNKVSLYRVQIGQETEISRLFASRTEKLPSFLQIHCEPLSCFLHLVRVLKLPTSVLIGQRSPNLSDKAPGEELQVIYEIGELLAISTGMCFSKDKIKLNPLKAPKDDEKPWRALYG